MNVTDSEDVLRLSTVIDRQRHELDRIRAAAAGEAVVSMARGALMERLGLSSAEAASQLAELSAATGIPLAEMATAVLSPQAPDAPEIATEAGAPGTVGDDGALDGGSDDGGARGADASSASAGTTGPRSLMIEAAAELAADGAELVGTLALQVLAPLGASTVVLWLLEADGALTLLGEAGLPLGEARRWWHIPPQLDCPAQRVARGAADIWWPAGLPDGDSAPVTGHAAGARAVLALRERNAELLGVMEVGWPAPLPAFGTEIRGQLSALAAGSARVIGSRLAHGSLAAAHPKPAVYALLDGLAEAVMAVRAIRDDDGRVTDFSIEHVSPGFRDPAGRTTTELTGLTLLEAYPASVVGQGLFTRATQVLADGAAQYVPGPASPSRPSTFPGAVPRGPARGQVLRRRDIHLAARRAGRPAGEGHLVGGDWYDAMLLPDNEVLLVVGDVAGHGIDAVTGMVAARNSLRGLAITGAGPAELLRMLNGVMCHLTSGVVGTVVCGRYSPATRVLRWARAGHLPPVLLRGGERSQPRTARQLPLPGGMLLGMDPDAAYEEASEPLERGDTLLLFTDGLIEQRGESIDDVLRDFVTILGSGALDARGTRRLTAAAQADRVLARAVSDTADDACLVVIRIA